MKRMVGLMLCAAPLLLAACASESVDPLKSPCVGLEGSPCGPKRVPVQNTVSIPQGVTHHTAA